MSDQGMIEVIAAALAIEHGGAPNSTDRDFAKRFLRAHRALVAIERDQSGDDETKQQQ